MNVQSDAFITGVCHRLLRFRILKLLRDVARARFADFQDCSADLYALHALTHNPRVMYVCTVASYKSSLAGSTQGHQRAETPVQGSS